MNDAKCIRLVDVSLTLWLEMCMKISLKFFIIYVLDGDTIGKLTKITPMICLLTR